MIVTINNSLFTYNNQQYNILNVDEDRLNLSYQGPFWDTTDIDCTISPYVSIAFNEGFGATACSNETSELKGEYNDDYNKDFRLVQLQDNQYDIQSYNGSENMVDIEYSPISELVYVLGNSLTIIDSYTSEKIGDFT
jgi:rRNA maturation protein Rpf1